MKPVKYLTGLIIFGFLLVACGPSAEEQASLTASAWTATPSPTNTPTPTSTPTATPTPLPYDLMVSVVDEAGLPIGGASIVLPESGSSEQMMADDTGKYSWSNLPGADVTLNVSAQGYLPMLQTNTLERGPSEVSVVMQRDPYGLLSTTVCSSDEKLLFMDDFQSGLTNLVHYNDGGAPVPLGPAVDEPGNTVLVHDFTTPVGDYSTYYNHDATTGEVIHYGDAVWRFRFEETQETNWNVFWNMDGPEQFGGITTSSSGYQIGFNTARHILVQRDIWDETGARISTIGKSDLAGGVLIVQPNTWHYLEISTYQGNFQIWLDGKSVVDVTDDMPLPSGSFSIQKGDNGIIYYDAISVCGLSAPFVSLTPAVPVVTP